MLGKAYIIGAGPGDFELLTLKAKRIIENADCIIYDRLIPDEILHLNTKAEMIYLGKGNSEGGTIQEEINKTLVSKCLEGKIVARVKGGDPFVFGRGGEEIFALNEHGISFEVIPGISSSISVPSYAGIPVTHRGLSRSFHVFTGHTQKNGGWHNFEAIAKLEGTLVFLMGVKNLPRIVSDLKSNGKDEKTLVAIIEKGATENQRVTVGTLENILDLAKERDVKPPAIIVIGEVVGLRPEFSWFDKNFENINDVEKINDIESFENVENVENSCRKFYNKDIGGRESKNNRGTNKKILVTRAKKDSASLVEYINKNGGTGKSLPFIEIEYLDFSLKELEGAKAILFNSPNGVHAFMKQIEDLRILAGMKIGVVGEKTYEALKKHHIIADFMPKEYLGEKLAGDAASLTNKGEKIIIISSDIAPWSQETYSNKLDRNFVKIVAYRTKPLHQPKERIIQELKDVDVITFLSSSTVKSFYDSIKGDLELVKNKEIASIGPMTSKTLVALGFNVDYEPKKYTAKEMIKEVLK